MGNDIGMVRNAEGLLQINPVNAGIPTLEERDREKALRDAAKAVFAAERTKKGGSDAAREAAKREAGRAESARANRLEQMYQANMRELNDLKVELAERNSKIAEQEPYVARLRAEADAERAAAAAREAAEQAEREAREAAARAAQEEEQRERQRLEAEMAARQAEEEAQQADQAACAAQKAKKANKYNQRSMRRQEAKAGQPQAEAAGEKPERFFEDPIKYEEWARNFFDEALMYWTYNMTEYSSFQERKYNMSYAEGRSRHYTALDIRAYRDLNGLVTLAIGKMRELVERQKTSFASFTDMRLTQVELWPKDWSRLHDELASLFDEFLSKFAPSVTPPFREWTLEGALECGLVRNVYQKDALSDMPFLTAPAPFHIAVLMQTARTAERRGDSPNAELLHPQMTKIDVVLTVLVVALKLCFYAMNNWVQVLSSVAFLVEQSKDDEKVAETFRISQGMTVGEAVKSMVLTLRDNLQGAVFDPGMIEQLLTTMDRLFEKNGFGVVSESTFDRALDIKTLDTLFSTWVNNLANVGMQETPDSYARFHLVRVLRERIQEIQKDTDRALAEGTPKAWRLALPFELFMPFFRSVGVMWHGLLEMAAREFRYSSAEDDFVEPFFEGVLQKKAINPVRSRLLTQNMPTVAFMYGKRRELRRNNWGHRYWGVGYDLHISPNLAATYNHALMTSGSSMTPGEIDRYTLRFAGLPSDAYYHALYNAQRDQKEAAAAAAQAKLLAEEAAEKEKAGSSSKAQKAGGKAKGKGGKGK